MENKSKAQLCLEQVKKQKSEKYGSDLKRKMKKQKGKVDFKKVNFQG